MDEKFRSRKFLIVAVTLAFSGITLLAGKLDGADFATIAIVCVGAYAASNSFEGRNKSVG